jgi:hypothetical protein
MQPRQRDDVGVETSPSVKVKEPTAVTPGAELQYSQRSERELHVFGGLSVTMCSGRIIVPSMAHSMRICTDAKFNRGAALSALRRRNRARDHAMGHRLNGPSTDRIRSYFGDDRRIDETRE